MYNQIPSRIWALDQDCVDLGGDKGHPERELEKRFASWRARPKVGIEKQNKYYESTLLKFAERLNF
jgi:hypothetical protein